MSRQDLEAMQIDALNKLWKEDLKEDLAKFLKRSKKEKTAKELVKIRINLFTKRYEDFKPEKYGYKTKKDYIFTVLSPQEKEKYEQLEFFKNTMDKIEREEMQEAGKNVKGVFRERSGKRMEGQGPEPAKRPMPAPRRATLPVTKSKPAPLPPPLPPLRSKSIDTAEIIREKQRLKKLREVEKNNANMPQVPLKATLPVKKPPYFPKPSVPVKKIPVRKPPPVPKAPTKSNVKSEVNPKPTGESAVVLKLNPSIYKPAPEKKSRFQIEDDSLKFKTYQRKTGGYKENTLIEKDGKATNKFSGAKVRKLQEEKKVYEN